MIELVRKHTCCFTGHRKLNGDTLWLRFQLQSEILRLYRRGIHTFLTGGALGFDTMAANEVLRLRDSYIPDMLLAVVIPCWGQESRWRGEDQELYQSILRRADDRILTGELYTPECMRVRNRYLVEHSSCCVAWLEPGRRGGTSYTVNYARSQGLEVVNLFGKKT